MAPVSAIGPVALLCACTAELQSENRGRVAKKTCAGPTYPLKKVNHQRPGLVIHHKGNASSSITFEGGFC